MMVATAAQMKELDRQAIEEYGIPSLDLMEHAAQAVADEVAALLARAQGGHACLAAQSSQRAYLRQRHAQRAVEQDALQRIHLIRAIHPVARFGDAGRAQQADLIVVAQHPDADSGQL